jgi:hypothetical protein
MEPMKLNVLFCMYSYSGNGGMRSEHPDVRDWLLATIPKATKDERVGRIGTLDEAETPITMNRNKSVVEARKGNWDIIVMVDSDMSPDRLLGHTADAKPFWDTAFDFLYRHYPKGPAAIAAPYGGPPDYENVYVFTWRNHETGHLDETDAKLAAFTREEAAVRTGIEDVGALPTGLIMWDTRIFELTEPKKPGEDSWFYYEYNDIYQSSKASTEDVTATRDISLVGTQVLGYNPIYVAWDCWAGHHKAKCVTRPQLLTAEMVGDVYARGLGRPRSDEGVLSLKQDRLPPLVHGKGAVAKLVERLNNGN